MRVIAGEFRSRLLKTLPGMSTRPTPDRMRESLFSILGPAIEGVNFVDAYAGSGAVGIEALSRGAAHVVFIERSRPAVAVIKDNLQSLDIESRATVLLGKASQRLPALAGDIVFVDPPYELTKEYGACFEALENSSVRLLLMQHPSRLHLPESNGRWVRYRQLRQGDNTISFYRPGVNSEETP